MTVDNIKEIVKLILKSEIAKKRVEKVIESIDYDQAILLADQQLNDQLKSENLTYYNIEKTNVVQKNNSITVDYVIVCEENIAIQEILSINTVN